MFVMGIDLGTQGVRALVVDRQGRVHANAACSFAPAQLAEAEPGHFEQDPYQWRQALFVAIGQATAALRKTGFTSDTIIGLSVTSTSGTLCLVDEQGEPLHPAIMYSDTRSAAVADLVQTAGSDLATKLGTRFSASFALPKLLWLGQGNPQALERARWFLNPTDLVIGWLTGVWGYTDWTNALKWGYDIVDLKWPSFIEDRLQLPKAKFPSVHAPGTFLARVSQSAAQLSGLATSTRVYAGSTDGTASQLASGAVEPGSWNSTLGTTLVIKGVSDTLLRDPQGRIYCHRHPEGHWLPGGASSTGADCLSQRFEPGRLAWLNEQALSASPTHLTVYPLVRKGERLPFRNPEALGFTMGEPENEVEFFAAHLESIAYVEALCYSVLAELGGRIGDTIHVAGGGSKSSAGLQIRADVLNKRLLVPTITEGAMGAAILAAQSCLFGSLSEASKQMVTFGQEIVPRPNLIAPYASGLERFRQALRSRGYLP